MKNKQKNKGISRQFLTAYSAVILFGWSVASEASPITATNPATETAQIHYHSTDINGIKIFYREAGDPKNPTILLLHGFSSSSHMFRDLIPLLSKRFHLIAPDYPGFGYSDAPPTDIFTPTFENLESVMSGFVTALELKSFIVYMQDFGGPVGFRMAVKHPEWIGGLIIQNANAYREGIIFQPSAAAKNHEKTANQKMSVRAVTPEFIRSLYQYGARDISNLNPDAWAMDIAVLNNPEAKRIQAALIDDYSTNIAQYSAWHDYLRERQPKTLIVWGKNDRAFSITGAEAYRQDIRNVEIQYFDTGHFALEEDAPAMARTIEKSFEEK